MATKTETKEEKNTRILNYAESLSDEIGAKYSKHDADVLADYSGCVDADYPETFLSKLWALLKDEVYSSYDSFTPVRILAVNNLGAKLMTNAPKNSEVVCLNNNYVCYLASRAILQQQVFDWGEQVTFGSIADYFYLPYDVIDEEEVFNSYKYQIVMVNYEKDNECYKAIDYDKELTALPYYIYCIVRAANFICPEDLICLTLPDEKNKEFLDFDLSKYGLKVVETKLKASDVNYKAHIIKPISKIV